MRKERVARKERLALQVGIALTAGVFGAVPVAEGAPVLDKVVTAGTQVAQSGSITDVTGTQQNNIVKWTDFSVNQGETVRFDKGAQEKNYLNLVTGPKTSEIAGSIEGGKDVYLVNPHGVIFSHGAQVNVGNLYVSTENTDAALEAFNAGKTAGAVLTAGTANADVVNLGGIAASSVVVNGDTIRFLTDNVQAQDVTLQAAKSVVKEQTATQSASTGVLRAAALAAKPSYVLRAPSVSNKTAITDATGLAAMNQNLSGDYSLEADLTLSGSYKPIGGNSYGAFTGKFDGNFHTISGIKVSGGTYGGLFGLTSGATIQNVGVKDGAVTAVHAGGIVGKAVSTTLTDVYNAGVSINAIDDDSLSYSGFSAGGIAGYAENSTIEKVYNTGNVSGDGAGLIGAVENGTVLKNAYNTGTAIRGVVSYAPPDDTSNISCVYTTQGLVNSTYYHGKADSTTTLLVTSTNTASSTSSSTYKGFDISSSGSDNTVWRIYEGHSLPLLRDFLRRGKGAVTVNYHYTQKCDSNGGTSEGDVSGKDLKLTYSNGDVELSNITFTNASGLTIDEAKITQDTEGLRNANVYTDTNDKGETETSNGKMVFYCTDQDGYDLVGGNVYIKQQEVDISGASLAGKHVTKVYDGSTDATEAVRALFNASDTSVSGLFAGDTTVDFDKNNLTATFDDKNVGVNKTVTATGTISLTQTAHNYKITGDGSSINGAKLTGDITPRTLYLTVKNSGFKKPYDGNTKVMDSGAAADQNLAIDTSKGADHQLASVTTPQGTTQDTITFDTSNTTVAYDSKNAGENKTISYENIALKGDNASNYRLVAENAQSTAGYDVLYDPSATTAAKGVLKTTGSISQRVIDPTTFSVKDADGKVSSSGTKVYDGKTAFDSTGYTLVAPQAAATGDTGIVAGENITFSIVPGKANFEDENGNTTSQVTKAKQIGYDIQAVAGKDTNTGGTTLLSNYVWGKDGKTLTAADTYQVTTPGTIKKRALTVQVTQPKDVSLDKDYDGTTAIVSSAKYDPNGIYGKASTFGAQGYVDYTERSLTLVTDETNKQAPTLKVTAAYDSKGVNRTAAGQEAQARNIDYTVTLSGENADNYTINGYTIDGYTINGYTINEQTSEVTLRGEQTGAHGKIYPKDLASSFAEVTKTYDGTTDMPAGQALGGSLAGVISGDDAQLASGATAQFESKDVRGSGTTWTDANGKTWKNWVNYENLSLTGTDALNYDLASSAKGGGTITPLALTADDLDYRFDKITKEYDGTTAISAQNAAQEAARHLLTVTVKADKSKARDVFKGTVAGTPVDHTANVTATYERKDSKGGASQTVNYALTVQDDGSGNFTLPSGGLPVTAQTQGTITPRKVIATAPTGIRKEYDATDAVVKENANDPLISYTHFTADGQPGLVSGDADASTGVYQATAAAKANGEQDADAGAKDVLYTLGIQTSDPTNYEIVNASGQKVQTLTGSGTIDKRRLTISFAPTKKAYDGTAAVPQDAAHILPQFDDGAGNAVIAKDGTQAAFDVKQVCGEYHDAAGNKVSDVGTGLAVAYSNLVQALGSTYAKNYIVNGGTDAAKGTGDITKLKLTNLHFSFDVTKEYDGTTDVAYTDRQDARHEAVSFIGDHYVDLNGNGTYDVGDVLLGGADKSGLTIQSAQYAGKDAGNQQVTYEIGLGNLNNYDLSGISNVSSGDTKLTYANGVLTAKTQGTITPRKVYASLATPKEVTKVYDGDTSIRQGKALQNIMSDVRLDGLLAGDGVRLDSSATQATYADENAGRNKNVCYKIALTGAQKKNYEVVGADGNPLAGGQLVSTGTGTIEKAPLTIGFGRVEKTFDNSSDVTTSSAAGDATTIQPTLSGFVNSETAAFDQDATRLIEGYYTAWDGKTGTPAEDVHVRRDSSGSVVDKAVCYKGIDKAFADLAARDDVLKNYEIAAAEPGAQFLASGTNGVKDTVYFSEALQKGRIKPLALAQGQIQEKWTASTITKEYDTTDQVLDPKQYFTLHETVTGKDIPITYDLKSAVYDNHRVDQTNGQQVGVTYTINGISQQALGDFVIDQTTQDAFKNQTYHTTGEITPKLIRAKLDQTADIVKTYDGRTDADPKNFVFYDAQGNRLTDDGIYPQDKLQVQAVVKAEYDDKNATIAPGAAPTNARKITYTLDFTDKTGNYALDTSFGSPATSSAAQNTYLATGDIARRQVYVDFTGGSLDKLYDGTPNLKSSGGSLATLLPLDAKHETGVVQGDDVHLDASKASGRYASAHVRRDASGKPVAQDVYLSGITFGGNDVGNYILAANPGSSSARTVTKDGVTQVELTGHGVISPVTIAVSLKNRSITKEYDGTTAVDSKYLSDNLQWDTAPLVARGDKLVTKWVHTPAFASKNVKGTDGRGTNPVTFDFSWSNVGGDGVTYHDYDVVPGTSGSVTGQGAQAVAHLTANGKITPRLLIASSGARATKVYDATPDVLGDAGKNLVFTRRDGSSVFGMGDTINDLHVKADAKYLETAPGRGDAADATAGVAADGSSLPLLDHDVAYTNITLGNDNYALDPASAKSVTGKGTITRATLKLTAEPVTIRAWQDLPLTYQGQASGWQGSDGWAGTDIRFAPAADQRNYPAGKYPIWAWYRTGQDALGNGLYTRIAQGAYGKNYEVVEDPANRTALTILPGRASDLPLPPDMPTAIDAATASGKGFIPDRGAYNHISHDEGHTVVREPRAGLSYAGGGINVGEMAFWQAGGASADAVRTRATDVTRPGGTFTRTGAAVAYGRALGGVTLPEAPEAPTPGEVPTAAQVRTEDLPPVRLFSKEPAAQEAGSAALRDMRLFGDAVPVQAATVAPVRLFDDEPDEEAAASPAVEVTTAAPSDDEEEKDKEQQDEARAAALKAKGAAIGIESEGAGVNLAG